MISGNGAQGILVRGSETSQNEIVGNWIGTNPAGTGPVANGYSGTEFSSGASANTLGPDNLIAGNSLQGVLLIGAGTDGNVVSGNRIGLNASGSASLPNGWAGVELSGGVQDTTVGGFTAAGRNIISGNGNQGVSLNGTGTDGNRIMGNFIGTNPAGTGAIPNGYSGAVVYAGASGNTLGPDNVISGNSLQGVLLADAGTDGNVVSGNLIGLNESGSATLPNGWAGVELSGGVQNNTVGGVAAAARNVISGNSNQGVSINGAGTTGNRIAGNFIGTDETGTTAAGNGWPGIDIYGGAAANTIGGTEAGAGNVIGGNGIRGITLAGAGTEGNVLSGNLIGLSASGTAAIPNAGAGIQIFDHASGNRIGVPGGRNFIAGNSGEGITVSESGTDGNLIRGNSIGGKPDGTPASNAADGIAVWGGAHGTQIGGSLPGEANWISGNGGNGIAVYDAATTGTKISGNGILGNSGLGIDLGGGGFVNPDDNLDGDEGPNQLQNYPVLTSAVLGTATTVTGSLNSLPGATFRIEFFASPAADGSGNGEGRYFIGAQNATTGGTGNAAVDASLAATVPAGWVITATATDAAGNTSEFSVARAVTTTDTDSDGMPDAWESANGLQPGTADAALDSDHDGVSNGDEFREGTDPRNAASVFRPGSPVLSGSGFAISIPTVLGKTYEVEWTTDFTGWRILTDQIAGTGTSLTVMDPTAAGADRRLYRVTVVPP